MFPGKIDLISMSQSSLRAPGHAKARNPSGLAPDAPPYRSPQSGNPDLPHNLAAFFADPVA
jgi:hypothetical protein